MTIVIYSKPNCIYCDKSRKGKGGLTYEEKMFGKDFNSQKNYTRQLVNKYELCAQIKIDGELIGGYNQAVEHFVIKV